MLEAVFSHGCEGCIFFSSVWKLNAPPCILFPGDWVGRDTNNSTSSDSNGEIFIIYNNTDLSFFFFCQSELMTPFRNCSVDTELIDRVNCLEQEFCIYRITIEVNCTSAFPLLQDPTTQSSSAFEDRMTSLFESLYHFVGGAFPLSFLIVGIAIPLFLRSWTQKRPMSLQEFYGVPRSAG